jgi:hypothetical protein
MFSQDIFGNESDQEASYGIGDNLEAALELCSNQVQSP